MSSTYVTWCTNGGDLALGANNVGMFLIYGGDAIVQGISEDLKMFMGEWFLDLSNGTPFYRDILGQKGSNKTVIRSVIKARIAQRPGVLEVLSVDIDFDRSARRLTARWKARIAEATSQGLITVGGVTFLLDGSGNTLTTGGDSLTT